MTWKGVVNAAARQMAKERRRQIAEAKRLERERVAHEKKRIAEAKRLEKVRIAQEKKKLAEAERDRKAQERKEKAQYIDNNKVLADNRTIEAQKLLKSMDKIIDHALSRECTIDFDSLKNTDEFLIPKPEKPLIPQEPTYQMLPPEPDPNDEKYNPKFGVFDFAKKKESKKLEALGRLEKDKNTWNIEKQNITEVNNKIKSKYEADLKENENIYLDKLEEWENKKKEFLVDIRVDWERERQEIIDINQKLKLKFEAELKELENVYLEKLEEWENKKKDFLIKQEILNEVHEGRKENYFKGDPNAIHHYSSAILSNSEYHEDFPQEFELEYNPENKILIVDYQLPSIENIPTLKDVKYVQSRDEFTEKHLTKTQLNKLYDNILYHITLRTIHELFEAHEEDLIDAIIFNGHVKSIDPGTGQETSACVLSVQANKEDFGEINLAMIDPKACFKKLRGVGSSKLHSLTPIPPLVKMDREDSRFTDSYSVIDGVDEGYNLATMDWKDFENLIREVFEQAYAETGGEVKITQASRDGGIDAVIFDPDPLRGGKIVIQAKRYTNVVGVAAVRELFGTLSAEGANKGILVTTSDFGPDAYKFVADKPIELFNGNNLLFLLEKYGHKARIDLKEAKTTLNKEKNDL